MRAAFWGHHATPSDISHVGRTMNRVYSAIGIVMIKVLTDGIASRLFTRQYQSVLAFGFERPGESLKLSIHVGCSRR